MNSIMEYKGYRPRIKFDADAMLLHGKIEGINDLVTFECENTSQIESEFYYLPIATTSSTVSNKKTLLF